MADRGIETAQVAQAVGARLRGLPTASEYAPRVGVAFSGGLDSTVLLHACVEALGPTRVVALHVHHGLQPAADAFVAHVRKLCERWHVQLEVLTLQTRPPPAASIEAWASEQRYEAMAETARTLAPQQLALTFTAHHEDDQAETLMLRLMRGTGLHGLTGIAPETERHGHLFVRPLLGLSRAALLAHAQLHGLQWIEDPSNASQRFARNAARLRLMPLLEELAPGAAHRIAQAASHLQDSHALLREYLGAELDPLVQVIGDRVDWLQPFGPSSHGASGAMEADGTRSPGRAASQPTTGRIEVLDALRARALTPAKLREVLRLWVDRLGMRPMDEARGAQLVGLVANSRATYGQLVHEGLLFIKHRHRLFAVQDGEAMLERVGRPDVELPFALLMPGPAPASPGPARGVLAELRFTPGDWRLTTALRGSALFQPEGSQHAKSLKDTLQGLGVPRWLRGALPILLAPDGRVAWVPGAGVSAGFAPAASTPRPAVLQVSVKPGQPATPEHRLLAWVLARSGL